MKTFYSLFGVLTLALSTLPGTCAHAQTTLGVLDFDGTTPEISLATDQPFFIGGTMNTDSSDAFFGIHDADGDPTDGTPNDTGMGDAANVATAGVLPITGDFLFIEDLDDEGDNGRTGFATITLGPVDLTGEVGVQYTFDYNIVDFNSTDQARYQFFYDGAGEGEVTLPLNGRGGVAVEIPDVVNSVTLELRIRQNGVDQFAAFDNFLVTADNTTAPCGITSFGPADVICLSESTDPGTDFFRIEIPYTGVQPGLMLQVDAGATTPANDVTATTTNSGDDPAVTPDGTIVLTNSAGEFEEGDEVDVIFFTAGGECRDTLRVSTTENQCNNPCDINFNPAGGRYFCESFTANTDQMYAYFPFSGGPEPGATFSVSAGVVIDPRSDDPETDDDGFLIVTGFPEGGNFTITLSGGPCGSTDYVVTAPADFCTEPDIVINEVLADPAGNGAVNDTNGDGVTDGGEDEFIELYNRSDNDIDVSGFTVENKDFIVYVFPANTILPARTGFVIIGDPTGNSLSCPTNTEVTNPLFGISLNNTDDLVALRTDAGEIVHNMSYGAEGEDNQSLTLNPDGQISGPNPYVQHTMIANNPVSSSPCIENDDPAFTLPVSLTEFTATPRAKTVELRWTTAQESGNDRYEVERSTGGVIWTFVGTVPAGRTNGEHYDFVDATPLPGQSFYRLRQVDTDGTTTLYGPRVVQFAGTQLSVYPNPTNGLLRLNRTLDEADHLTVLGAGARVQGEVRTSNGGLDVSSLPAGVYFLRLERADGVETVRFIKR